MGILAPTAALLMLFFLIVLRPEKIKETEQAEVLMC